MGSHIALVSRQRWKLWLFGVAVGVIALGFLTSTVIGRKLNVEPALVNLVCTFLGLLTLIAASLLIRCPSCRLSLVWYGVSKQPHQTWLSWLLDVQACPKCNFQHREGEKHNDTYMHKLPTCNDYFNHPERFPKNAPGAFYTLGDIDSAGTWCGRCLSCNVPEEEAPTLLAPLTETNSDTYFIKQPETDEEVDQACCAIEVCCVDALRYGGKDQKILARLSKTGNCDYSNFGYSSVIGPSSRNALSPAADFAAKKWWQLWK